MARRKGTSRVSAAGASPGSSGQAPRPQPEFPSIRQRKPGLYWTLIVAVVALLVPLFAGLVQLVL